jgi:hypothetical protein
MTTWMISGILGFVAGGAFIWFFRDRIEKAIIGANALSKKLHDKADAIKNLA